MAVSIGEWRLAAGDSLFGASTYFGCHLLLVQSDSSSALLPLRNLHKSPYFMPRPQAFGFFPTIILPALSSAVAALCLFQSNSSLVVLCSHILFSTIAGCASLDFLLRRWQSGGRKTEKVDRGCSIHEMKWTELHIHGLFCSFSCVANAFYRSSLRWTKMGFFSSVVARNELCYQRVWRWVT